MLAVLFTVASPAWAQPTFDKTFIPDSIGPGSSSRLTFTIDNGGSIPVLDLTFTDNLPAGVTIATPANVISDCVNALIDAPEGGATITFSNARLGASQTCTTSVDVTASTPGTYMNVSGDLTSTAGNSGTATDDLTVTTARPGFSKAFSPATLGVGQRSTLTLTIDNSANPGLVTGISFIDPLPLGMEIADPANAATDCLAATLTAPQGGDQISIIGGALLAGNICTVSVDIRATAPGRLENVTSELASSPGGPLVSSGRAGAVLDVTVGDNLILTKEFTDDPVLPGGAVNLEFTLTNRSRLNDAIDISFTDDLDATLSGLVAVGLPAIDVCGAGSQLSGSSTLTLVGGNLPPESTCTFSVMLQTPAAAVPGAYVNTTSAVTATQAGQPVTDPAASDTLFVSDGPTVTKTFLTNPVGAGDTTTMEFTITNNSSTSSATGISFQDNISEFLSGVLVFAFPPSGFCGPGSIVTQFVSNNQTIVLVSGGSLAPGASCTFGVDLLTAVGTPAGDYLNRTNNPTATVNGVTVQSPAAEATLSVLGIPEFSKEFTDDPVMPGDTVTLNFTLDNSAEGTVAVNALSFTDNLDAVLTGLTAVGLPQNDICGIGSQISGTSSLTFSGGSLAPGEVCSFDITLQVPATALPGTYTNTTSSLTAANGGMMVTGQAASNTLIIGGIDFSKQFIGDPVPAGAMVDLEFTISNQSPTASVSGIFFTDSLNSALSGLAAVAPLPTEPCGVGSAISGTTNLIVTGGNLAALESCTFTVSLQVPAAAANGNYLNVTSNLVATFGGSSVSITPASDSLVIDSPQLSISKMFTDDPVVAGDTVTLEYTISNPDAVNPATAITFTDDLDAALTGLTTTGLPLNDACGVGSTLSGSSIITLLGGNLPAGGNCTFAVTLQLPAIAAPGDYPSTTSVVRGTINGATAQGAAATDVLQVVGALFSKNFAGPVVTGQSTTLTYSITNSGSSPLTQLRFSDDLNATLMGLTASALPADPCGVGSTLSGSTLLELANGSLAGGATCTFAVTVTVPAGLFPGIFPSTSGPLFAGATQIALAASDDLEVLGQAMIDVAPLDTDFGDVRVGVTSAPLAVTVTNPGTGDLTVSSLTAATAPFALAAGGTCGATPFIVAPMASCTLQYNFTPSAVGAANQTLTADSNALMPMVNFTLRGNGIEPALAVAPATLDFGTVDINTTSTDLSTTLSNTGTDTLIINALTGIAAPFALTGGTCGATPITIAVGANCTLTFNFSPTVAGPVNATVSIASDAPDSPATLTLQGIGGQGALALTPSPLNFVVTNVGSTSSETLTLSNTGDGTLSVTAISDPLAPFVVLPGTCGATPITLAVSASCTLTVEFTPTVVGDVSSSISFDNDGTVTPVTVDLNGRGGEAILMLDTSMLDFEITPLGIGASLPLVLTNIGDGDLIITALGDPLAPFSVQTDSCGALPITLAPSASCSLLVLFEPSSPGDFVASLTIESNDANSPATVALQGTGVVIANVPTLRAWTMLLLVLLLLAIAAWRLRQPLSSRQG
ncbi:MAG: hypothetical protein Tsb002_38410 [Wenzhouxiangellaceae bacterium]